MRRGLVLFFFLGLGLGQSLELGAEGMSPGVYRAYLLLEGLLSLEGGEIGYAFLAYRSWGLGEGRGLRVERLYLRAEEGAWGLLLGRFPLGLGEARLLEAPTVWDGGILTHYGEGVRLRAGYLRGLGGVAELAWSGLWLRGWLGEGLGLVLGGSFGLGQGVVYGEAGLDSGPRFLLGLTGVFLEEGLYTLEAAYPWGLALGLLWPPWDLSGVIGVRQGVGFGGLEYQPGPWCLGVGFQGEGLWARLALRLGL